jgi:hypothetical protein|tara:strand:+ start:342 stop:545 length:204 start_codon:yes stop_codon:yes gene_type:complete
MLNKKLLKLIDNSLGSVEDAYFFCMDMDMEMESEEGINDIHYSVLEDLEGVRTLLYRILEEYDPDHY